MRPPQAIQSGTTWRDDRGLPIQAHGGSITKVGSTYFWFGTDYGEPNPESLCAVACYASKDLVNWKFQRHVLKEEGELRKISRPKVLFNALTKKFVMYVTIADELPQTKRGEVGVAVCSEVDGSYCLIRRFYPLEGLTDNIESFPRRNDASCLMLQDPALRSTFVGALSDDYLRVDSVLSCLNTCLIGSTLFTYRGLYYVVGSKESGDGLFSTQYATAAKLQGPWSALQNADPPGSNTYGAQSTSVLKISGSAKATIIFMSDIWRSDRMEESGYLWMPVEMGAGNLWIPAPRPWSLNVDSGEAHISGVGDEFRVH